MALAEVADRSEVRRIERDNHHEIVPLAAGSSNAPRRIQPACIAMQQKRNHHARIERRLAEPTHIAAHDRLEIQALPHQPNDKPRDVVLRHEVPHIRRQKQRLIDIPGAKVLAHSPSLNQTRWDLNSDYSDRLLVLLSHNVAAFADEESCIWQDSLFSKRGAEMDLPKSGDATSRFLAFVEGLTSVIGHADRAKPLRDYCVGLMMPGERKSVEPMAAITAPERTAAQHQSLLHFVGEGT